MADGEPVLSPSRREIKLWELTRGARCLERSRGDVNRPDTWGEAIAGVEGRSSSSVAVSHGTSQQGARHEHRDCLKEVREVRWWYKAFRGAERLHLVLRDHLGLAMRRRGGLIERHRDFAKVDRIAGEAIGENEPAGVDRGIA